MNDRYVIVTESGSDMPKDLTEKYNVTIVPMHVSMGDFNKNDSETSGEEVFQYYDENKILPTTSGATPNDFTEAFKKVTEKYPNRKIIYIAYSAVTTVSYNSAKIASEGYDNIYFIDSKNVSGGLATIVIATAEYIDKNPNVEVDDLISQIKDIVERTRFVFMPQTLDYLRAGGRVSNASYIGAKIFKIFPTIKLESGRLIAGKKYRGTFEKSYKKMMDDFFKEYDIDKSNIKLVISSRLSDEHISTIEAYLTSHGVTGRLWITAGAVISSHGGPGAFGLVGIEKN